jgi:hypothetical protein
MLEKTLQLFPQLQPGSDAAIIGSMEGLKSLRAAIDKAIECQQSGAWNMKMNHPARAKSATMFIQDTSST